MALPQRFSRCVAGGVLGAFAFAVTLLYVTLFKGNPAFFLNSYGVLVLALIVLIIVAIRAARPHTKRIVSEFIRVCPASYLLHISNSHYVLTGLHLCIHLMFPSY